MRRHRLTVAVGMALLFSSPGTATAAEDIDSRWLPWLGCWQLWDEQVKRPAGTQDTDADAKIDARIGRTSVCVVPADAGITLTAMDGEELLVERQLVADATRRDITEGSCRGWESNEWSRDGHRLFTRSELQCADEPTRRVTGVSLMGSASAWIDIQHVEAGQYQQVEVRRYTPARPSPGGATEPEDAPGLSVELSEIRRARREIAENPNLADVMEASDKTSARVVEALLVETEPELDLDSHALIALDEAGIDHAVIDLLVALSYPERFVVQRRDRGGRWYSGSGGGFGGWYDPIWYSDLYPYYITPFGSRYWGSAYNPYFYGGAVGGPFVIIPSRNGSVGDGQPAMRAIKGRGYARVVPREVNGRTVVPRGSTGRSGSSGSAGRSGSSSGGTTATSGSYSGGSGRSSGGSNTGRRAVPRQ